MPIDPQHELGPRYPTPCLLLLCLVLSGCSSSHERADGGGGRPADASPRVDASPIFDAGRPGASCEELCQRRENPSDDGLCSFDTQPDHGPCDGYCTGLARASDAAQRALVACLERDPLCFQTVDACIYQTMYPDGYPTPVVVEGMGFEAYEGRTVFLYLDPRRDGDPAAAQIRDGGFLFEFEVTTSPGEPIGISLFVDVDEDGRCDGDGDVPFYSRAELTGSFDAPSMELRVAGPPERDFSWLCAML